jgi:integrase
MAERSYRKLTARAVANAKPDKGRRATMIADGGNLFLQTSISNTGHIRRSWIFKYELNGKRREMGLGPTRDVPLSEAREKAGSFRKQLLNGVDPFAAKRHQAQQRRLEAAKQLTFGQCVEQYLQTHDAAWKEFHRQQWRVTLTKHCAAISDLPVKDIDTDLVLRVLAPIWKSTTVTASRLRGRIERVLSWAKGRGLRTGENPARWSGHLDEMLASPKKIKKIQHHPAMSYAELPGFMLELRQRKSSLTSRALEFITLTAVRSNELRGAHRSEFDLDAKVWTIPADRMKNKRQHRVPLSNRAIEILHQCPGENPFALSRIAMLELLGKMRPGLTVHGFRSSFRDWAAERTNFPNHVVEMALAHSIGNAVERSYRRGDLFEKRKRLMQQWSDYCARPPTAATVTPIRKLSDA